MSFGKVGSKGELFPPKELREKMNLKPGETVIYHVDYGRLIVEKYISMEEISKKPPKAHLSFEEFKKDREEQSEAAKQ